LLLNVTGHTHDIAIALAEKANIAAQHISGGYLLTWCHLVRREVSVV
jgi:hypothetical protein